MTIVQLTTTDGRSKFFHPRNITMWEGRIDGTDGSVIFTVSETGADGGWPVKESPQDVRRLVEQAMRS